MVLLISEMYGPYGGFISTLFDNGASAIAGCATNAPARSAASRNSKSLIMSFKHRLNEACSLVLPHPSYLKQDFSAFNHLIIRILPSDYWSMGLSTPTDLLP